MRDREFGHEVLEPRDDEVVAFVVLGGLIQREGKIPELMVHHDPHGFLGGDGPGSNDQGNEENRCTYGKWILIVRTDGSFCG